MNSKLFTIIWFLIYTLTSCGASNSSNDSDSIKQHDSQDSLRPSFQDFFSVINKHCISCHKLGGMASSSDFSSLRSESLWAESRFIKAQDPEKSPIYYRLKEATGEDLIGPQNMPPSGNLSSKEIKIIHNFIENIEKGELNLYFETRHDRVNLLPYSVRIRKLMSILEANEDEFRNTEFYKSFETYRYFLGDHNYAEGISEQTTFTPLQRAVWVQAVQAFCQSETLKARVNKNPRELIRRAFAVDYENHKKNLVDEIYQNSQDNEEAFVISCTSLLSSLEFLTQTTLLGESSLFNYMNHLAAKIIGRPLNQGEHDSLSIKGRNAIPPIIRSWLKRDSFMLSIKNYMANLLRNSGQFGAIDYNLPSNLAMDLHANNRPFSEIITAQSCRDQNGEDINCDSQAPFNAGVLTTRAFLSKYAGAFNLSRAGKLLNAFVCQDYPLPTVIEPRAEKEALIEPFSLTEGTGFGNGSNCYVCHSQFAWHAQLFVKFDKDGIYREDANGLQDTQSSAESGFSTHGLLASHFSDPDLAKSEASQMLGTKVQNLREAAKVIADHPKFTECTVKNILNHYLSLDIKEHMAINYKLFEIIADKILKENSKPSFGEILVHSLSNDIVVKSMSIREGY